MLNPATPLLTLMRVAARRGAAGFPFTPPPNLRAKPSLCPLILLALLTAATLGVANSQTANGKYDTDGDGLIEVSNLEQLDAIRYDYRWRRKGDPDFPHR